MTREQLTEMRRRIAMAQRHLAEQEPHSRAWTAMVRWIQALEAQVSDADVFARPDVLVGSWSKADDA